MKSVRFSLVVISVLLVVYLPYEVNGELFGHTKNMIDQANKKGPYIGIVIPNLFELNPLLNYPEYKSSQRIIDVGGMYIV